MLEKDITEITTVKKKDIIFGEEDEKLFNKATECWICNEFFVTGDTKVRDHCHFTGRFRGAAHRICNFKYRIPYYTPVVFHNLSGYNSHLFVKTSAIVKGVSIVFPTRKDT